MKITIAKTSGFCMGVRVATNNVLKRAHSTNKPIQTLGPLIHNPQTLELLKQKNVTDIKRPDDITADTIVIRSHGIPPDIMKEVEQRSNDIIDATCPHVKRIHKIIDKHFRDDFDVIVFGDEGHAEVIGLMGFARSKGHLVNSIEAFEKLPSLKKICLVAQTTQSLEDYNKLKKVVLKKYCDAQIFDTICKATDRRQNEVRKLAAINEIVIVVGGKNSANSARLAEIAKESCKTVFHIETEAELFAKDFINIKSVAVVSGASTPLWLLERITEHLDELNAKNQPLIFKIPTEIGRTLISLNFYLAFGAFATAWFASKIQGLEPSIIHMATAALYIHSMYILNHLTKIKANSFEEIFKMDYLLRHRKISAILGLTTGISAIILSFHQGLAEFILILLAMLAGLIYHVNILPKNNIPFLRKRRLQEITLSKDIGIGLAWSIICVFFPYLDKQEFFKIPSGSTITAFFFVFAITNLRTILHDLRDIQKDRIVGRETLPIVFGKKFKKIFPLPLILITISILAIAAILEAIPIYMLLLSITPLYILLIYRAFEKGKFKNISVFDSVVDFIFYLPFLILYIIEY